MFKLATKLALFATLVISGCIVVDKIEFDDKINNPPQIISMDPPNDSVVIVDTVAENAFSVTIWDPDVKDVATYDAVIQWWENPYSSSTWLDRQGTCEITDISREEGALDPFKGAGVLLSINCNLDLSLFPKPVDDKLTLTRISISDRPFAKDPLLEAGARSVEVFWTLLQIGLQ